MPEKLPEAEAGHADLKRDLGIWSAAAIVVGTVIGSAIFLVPNDMVKNVGSPAMVFAVWIFGGMLTLFGALSYAELAAALPHAGGEYVYLREAYGPLWAFIYGWTQMWVAKSGSIATLATGFFIYLANFRPEMNAVWVVVPLPLGEAGQPLEIRYGQLLAMGVIVVLALINYFGVKVSGDLQVIATLLKVGLIAGIIVIGLGTGHGSVANYHTSIPAPGGITGFFAALVAALWAYDGWNNVSMVAAETRDPERNLPRALIAGTLVVIAIYLLANLAYFYVLPAADVASSARVAAETMRRILGSFGANAVSIVAMISIFAALNGSILSGSRVPFAMARDGLFFRRVAFVHPQHRTPSVSILALSAWGALLVLSGRYSQLYTYVIFASVILYGMATAAVIVLRFKRPDMPRPYRTLGYPVVPVVFVLAIACLVVSTLLKSPRESLMGVGLVALGLPFYFFWKKGRSA
ncbi:MAG TPA: amino acid permease [Bryobacteraceae bacterium]|jgi:APA family basic amino acid/polyamine antiporter|nr:amino acid permease [Bryobacteraceae bacterium]